MIFIDNPHSDKSSSHSALTETPQTIYENGENNGNNNQSQESDAGNNLRLRKKNKRGKYWGGKFVQSIKRNNGNFSEYSDDFAIEGLNHAFDSTNSLVRTVFYIIAFLAFGAFFLYTTIPLINDYNEKSVVTSLDTETGVNGLPLPIVTVCPHGSGIRCNCALWRKLHCRYRYFLERYDWMSRFDEWSCWTNFDHEVLIDGKYLTWKDPKCDDFNFTKENEEGSSEDAFLTTLDPCNIDEDVERYPIMQNMTADKLYKQIIEREKTPRGPYITLEEITFYGGVRLDKNIFFFNADLKKFDESWIDHRHYEWSVFKFCTQFRPPNDKPNAKQFSPGIENGMTIAVQGLSEENYPVRDMLVSTPTVDIHIGLNQDDVKTFDDLILNPRNEFITVPAGVASSIEYESSVFHRYAGWGSEESRTCVNTKTPRGVCTLAVSLDRAASECGCDPPKTDLGFLKNPNYMGCSFTKGSEEYACLSKKVDHSSFAEISLGICPISCVTKRAHINKNSFEGITKPQLLAWKRLLDDNFEADVDKSALVKIGMSNMMIEVVSENPLVSFGELMGQIGGNLGLWCGLSFLTMVEAVEFLVVAVLYTKGVYSDKGKTLPERARAIGAQFRP